jgi:hypothetical protein
MTSEELQAVKLAEAVEAPPPPPKPSELKVAARMRETRRLTEEVYRKVAAYAAQRGIPEGEALLGLGLGNEDDVIATEAELTSTRWLSMEHLKGCDVHADVLALVPQTSCLELQLCPLGRDAEDRLVVAMRDPGDPNTLAQLAGLTGGLKVTAARAGPKALEALIQRVYANSEDPSTWLER